MNKITPATIGIPANIKKKSENDELLCISSIFPDNSPANLFPSPDARNQIPNNTPNNLVGASLFTYDNPTGDKHSSPIVCIR